MGDTLQHDGTVYSMIRATHSPRGTVHGIIFCRGWSGGPSAANNSAIFGSGGGGGPRGGDQLSCDRTTDIKLCSFPLLIGLVIDRGAVMCGLSGLTQ